MFAACVVERRQAAGDLAPEGLVLRLRLDPRLDRVLGQEEPELRLDDGKQNEHGNGNGKLFVLRVRR